MRVLLALSVVVMITGAVPAGQGPATVPGKSAAPAASAPGTPSGSAENGKKIYTSYGCYQCHGYEAHGGGAGPRLAPRPLPFAAFSRYVRVPTGQMPPYTAKVVSDQELADIYAFLLTIPEPPAVNTIPILGR